MSYSISYHFMVRWSVISYPKSLSDIRKTYQKVLRDFRRNFFGYKNLPYNVFVCRKTKCFGLLRSMFRILHFRYRLTPYPKSFTDFLWHFALIVTRFLLQKQWTKKVKDWTSTIMKKKVSLYSNLRHHAINQWISAITCLINKFNTHVIYFKIASFNQFIQTRIYFSLSLSYLFIYRFCPY